MTNEMIGKHCFFCSRAADMFVIRMDYPPVPHCTVCFLTGWNQTYRDQGQPIQVHPIPNIDEGEVKKCLKRDPSMLTAPHLLDAIRTGRLRSRLIENTVALFIDEKVVVGVPMCPPPKVSFDDKHKVAITSNDVPVCSIQAETAGQARVIEGSFFEHFYYHQFDPTLADHDESKK